ncbi:hypothetical protein [Roseospira visakhapatnamensis]|uniref:Transposase n=1 Tax=Roseospira visakhapatnamensis TaxID=390880 RepID=A0A7W6WAM1_9PROT|nr:hypothetical protein [Roseospira visakhapatnamensis]MBB4266988.1 hypothetical protein [Roseospira visakhapatnamensis]
MVYNDERPHEALGQVPPATLWRPSRRPYPDHLLEPWYDPDHAVRRVRVNGSIKWAGVFVFVSEALVGEPVGIVETDTGRVEVRKAVVSTDLSWLRGS